MTYAADPRVDAYIDALPDWQQAICREVRDLVHAADHEVAETIKRTNRPYFVLQGNICALLAAKDDQQQSARPRHRLLLSPWRSRRLASAGRDARGSSRAGASGSGRTTLAHLREAQAAAVSR